MTSLLNPILQRFAEHFPIPTMARAVLERCLNPQHLDAWFETVAEGQYTRALLFSTLFELMMQVVSRQQPSIHAAYQAAPEPIAVSVKSVYNKLNGLEPGTSAALVRYSAEQAAALIAAVGGARPGLLAGYRVKILDGNWLAGREHRLAETRGQTAAPLPGKALLVFDPALEVITELVPSADAYTQERALLPAVLARVQPGELWIADRNFCTKGWLWGLHTRGAVGLVREHEQIRFEPLEAMRVIGEIDSGRVSEQRVVFHFTPKHASWLNQIELWFSILARKVIRRGSFRSQAELKQRLEAFIEYFNRTLAKPFRWTYQGKPLVA